MNEPNDTVDHDIDDLLRDFFAAELPGELPPLVLPPSVTPIADRPTRGLPSSWRMVVEEWWDEVPSWLRETVGVAAAFALAVIAIWGWQIEFGRSPRTSVTAPTSIVPVQDEPSWGELQFVRSHLTYPEQRQQWRTAQGVVEERVRWNVAKEEWRDGRTGSSVVVVVPSVSIEFDFETPGTEVP